jgi:tetratricopeptide (TPR) repeat protein
VTQPEVTTYGVESHSAHNNLLTFLRSPPFWQAPTAPQIFFGRDAELAQIVDMITANIGSHPARIAILGLGGYGKTTLARAVVTDKQIEDHFGDARYFVPCESVTSSGALLTELGKTLGVLEGGTDALWSRIQVMLTSKDSVICFDNFESPWDQHVETKQSVEELLSRVTVLPGVTVLITMRGAEQPAQTQWTQPFLKPLETLGPDSAKEIWQAIAGNYNEFSEKLIQDVDYVPLAIELLSHLSQVTSSELLWEEWNSKQIKAIQTGQENRLSNLEYSIQLSVNSGRMKANPAAKNLLGVLSMLPDGLHMKQLRKFKEMFVDIDVALCLQTLLQCSLIKLFKERYQSHPIIRHFCLNQDMLLPMHKDILESFYLALALSHAATASSEAYGEMTLEVNNTKATLLWLLESNYGDHHRLVKASNYFTTFCANIGDHSEKVISQAVGYVQRNSGDILLLIECFQTWGKLYYFTNNLEKAQEKLQEAERLCISGSLIHSPLYGCVLEDLGEICHRLDEFSNAEAYYQKALKLHLDTNDIQHQGNSHYGLGYLSLRQGKVNEASTFFQSAIQCHEKVNDIFHLGNDYTNLGQIYLQQNRLIEAESAFQNALKFHKIANSFIGQGHDYHHFGKLYLKLNTLDDARDAYEKALQLYKLVNNILCQGHVHQSFGKIHISQGRMKEAESSFKKALEFCAMANYAQGQGLALSRLGHIHLSRGQLHDAKKMLEKAIVFHQKAQNSAWESYDAEKLSTVIAQIEEGESTEQCME